MPAQKRLFVSAIFILCCAIGSMSFPVKAGMTAERFVVCRFYLLDDYFNPPCTEGTRVPPAYERHVPQAGHATCNREKAILNGRPSLIKPTSPFPFLSFRAA